MCGHQYITQIAVVISFGEATVSPRKTFPYSSLYRLNLWLWFTQRSIQSRQERKKNSVLLPGVPKARSGSWLLCQEALL